MRDLPSWSTGRRQIAAEIAAEREAVKVVLKTRNETQLLLDWVAHYRRLVGPRGLLIMDNMSDRRETLAVYGRPEFEDIRVVQFRGPHNNLHRRTHFPELFRALEASAGHYAIVDTDEFLVVLDEDANGYGFDLAGFLAAHPPSAAVPSTWLVDRAGRADIFWTGKGRTLDWGRAWGKPFYSGAAGLGGAALHNVELPAEAYATGVAQRLILLHLMRYDRAQRIRVNLDKLRANRVTGPGETIEQLLSRDTRSLGETMRRLIREIGEARAATSGTASLGPGEMRFADGRVAYFSDAERDLLLRHIQPPG